jgi:CRP-like cAMP-binding protein
MTNLWNRHHKSSPKLELLRAVPAFRGCTDRQLNEIASLVDEVNVKAGRTLTREGTAGREAFVIVEGRAAVMCGDEPVVALSPGEFIGEIAMIDGGRRTATVVATTPMRLLAIGPQVFGSFADQPAVARSLSKALASRLRVADTALLHERG